MKNQILLFLMLAFSSIVYGQSENPNPKVFSTPEVIWCGIDFSQAKCIGAIGFTEPEEIKSRYFNAWNQLVLAESDKYNVQKFYIKSKLTNDLSVVTERNKEPKVEELVTEKPYEFKDGQLSDIVKAYTLKDVKDGLGVLYVVESFNKLTESAAIHVVFFDVATKEIYWTKKYAGAPAGFGFRNYWAGAIHNTMQLSQKDYTLELRRLKTRKKSAKS